jgi:hypothetical protein
MAIKVTKGVTLIRSELTGLVSRGLSNDVPNKRKRLYSGDAGYCPRRAGIFIHSSATSHHDASSEFYFTIGDAIHGAVVKGLTASGVVLAKEWGIKDDLINLVGYVDAIIKVGEQPQVLEIKSCGATLPEKPKPEHVAQAITYSIETGLRDPIIFYVSRLVAGWGGKLIARQFVVEDYETALANVANTLATSFIFAKASMLADIPAHIKSERDCGFCPFTLMCWKGTEEFPLPKPTASIRKELLEQVEEVANAMLARMPAQAAKFAKMAPLAPEDAK